MDKIFLIDELYKDIINYPSEGTYLDRFLFYKADEDYDIDIDVCKKNIDIYLNNNTFFKGKTSKVEKQASFNRYGYKYQAVVDGVVYRGETLINCHQVILQIVNYESEKNVFSNDFHIIKKRLSESRIMDELYPLLNDFIHLCYTSGNFIAIPFANGKSLNQAKGRLKEKGYDYMYSDSCYTYLDILSKYFDYGIKEVSLVKSIDDVKEYSSWKNRYKNENGKKQFIEDNMLEEFFEGEKPKQFWKMTENGIIYDLNKYFEKTNAVLENRTCRMKEPNHIIVGYIGD